MVIIIYHQKPGAWLNKGGKIRGAVGKFVGKQEIFAVWLEVYLLIALVRPIVGMLYTFIVGVQAK